MWEALEGKDYCIMKVKYTAVCECSKGDSFAALPEVAWSDPRSRGEATADFYILCRVCHTRWNEELVESEDA